MEELTSPDHEKELELLNELVLDHLGIPRPGTAKHIQELQDELLPTFMEIARYSWLAASPYQVPRTSSNTKDPILSYLHNVTETSPKDIEKLNEILEDLGVHALLDELAASPYAASLSQIKLDPYEARLLQAVGHPDPYEAVLKYLFLAAQNPKLLLDLEKPLGAARKASLKAHSNIVTIVDQNISVPTTTNQPDTAAPKMKRCKIFTGLGTLFSGLVLITGNSVFIPSIPMTAVTALPVIGSLAAGVAATGKGIGEFLGEGEEQQPVVQEDSSKSKSKARAKKP